MHVLTLILYPPSFPLIYRQVEDLQFQLLELGVISGDQLEQTAETSQERLASLATQLEGEKQRVKDLEAQLMQPNDESSQERLASLATQLEGEKQRVKDLEAQLMQPNDESSQERLASLATQLEGEQQRVKDLEAQLQVCRACSFPDLHKHASHACHRPPQGTTTCIKRI